MTTNNYKKEEDVQETHEVALDNWNAASNRLDGVVTETATDLNRNYEILNWVEGQVSEEAQPFVQESKAITHKMAERVAHYDAVREQAKAFMKEMVDRHQRLAGDYEELQNDMVDMNLSNPLVERLVESVEENAMEMVWDDVRTDKAGEYEEAYGAAYDNVFTEIHEGIRENTGVTDWTLIYRMTNVLTGQDEPTDEQRDLMRQLIESFRKPEDNVDHE